MWLCEEKMDAYRTSVEDPVGKCVFGKPRRRWKNSIKINIRKIGYEDGRRMKLSKGRVLQLTLMLSVFKPRVLSPWCYKLLYR
jgi:hypothetical protein